MLVKQITDFNQAITFAQLPSPTGLTGKRYFLTDLSITVISTGTIWIPDGAQVLSIYNSTFSFTGGTGIQTFHSYTIPGGLLHANALLRLTISGGRSGSSNAGSLNINLAGNTLVSFTTNNRSLHTYRLLALTNSLSSSKSMQPAAAGVSQFGASGSAPTTFSVNFANNQTITWTTQAGQAADTTFGDFACLEWLR